MQWLGDNNQRMQIYLHRCKRNISYLTVRYGGRDRDRESNKWSWYCMVFTSATDKSLWFFNLFMLFQNGFLYIPALFLSYTWHLCQTCFSFILKYFISSHNLTPQLPSQTPYLFSLCCALSHSSVGGYTGRQRLLGGWRLLFEWWELQSTSPDFASVCGGKWQREAGPRCQEPVCQCSVCPAVQPFTWLPV